MSKPELLFRECRACVNKAGAPALCGTCLEQRELVDMANRHGFCTCNAAPCAPHDPDCVFAEWVKDILKASNGRTLTVPAAPEFGSRAYMAAVMDKVFDECRVLRGAGQKEYAHVEQNAFANFERVAERMGWPREAVLMAYAEKHLDGIHSWIQGHKSQREDVRGRINDVIVYLCLLRGMADQDKERAPHA